MDRLTVERQTDRHLRDKLIYMNKTSIQLASWHTVDRLTVERKTDVHGYNLDS